jgi:hypothetical protein
MISRRWTIGVTIGVGLFALAGCGGAKHPPPPMVDAAFKAKVAPLCTAASTALKAQGAFPYPSFDPSHPDVSDFPGIAAYEAKTVATETSWQSQLQALGKPSKGGVRWKRFLTIVGHAVKETAAQQAAAQTGAAAAFTQTYKTLSSQQKVDATAAKRIGLPSCNPGKLGS